MRPDSHQVFIGFVIEGQDHLSSIDGAEDVAEYLPTLNCVRHEDHFRHGHDNVIAKRPVPWARSLNLIAEWRQGHQVSTPGHGSGKVVETDMPQSSCCA